MPENTKTLSEFNEMGLHIARLNEIWMNCRHKRNRGNLIGWKWELDSAQIELSYDAKKLDEETGHKYIQTLKELDIKILLAEKGARFSELYALLKDKERLLREIQQECGKGTAYRDPYDDGLDE